MNARRSTPRCSPRRWMAVILLATLGLEGCMTWRGAPAMAPATVAAGDRSLRVTRAGGARVEVQAAAIEGDSLTGLIAGSLVTRSAIALSDIKSVEVRRVSAGRTVILGVTLGLTAGLVMGLSAARTDTVYLGEPPPVVSCPLVYSWDGDGWRLDSGTFGGAIVRGLQRTDLDNLDFATAQDGVLRLKVANELNETDYIDALQVVAVDHDRGLSVAPDPVRGTLHALGPLEEPVSAVDFRGSDALSRVRGADGWSWESIPTGRDPSRDADVRDGLELTFVRPAGARAAHLVLDGNNTAWGAFLLWQYVAAHGPTTQAWYDSLNADAALASATGARIANEAFLSASVWTGEGWKRQGLFWEAGPEVVKRQALDVDLTGVQGDTVRVRLESAPALWLVDRIAMDFTADRDLTATPLELLEARGPDGEDLRPVLSAIDDHDLVLETGESAELRFSAPPPVPGRTRSYLLRSTGWYHVNAPVADVREDRLLERVASEPLGLSRVSVERLNEALARMNRSVP
jgi:hypothetical protein